MISYNSVGNTSSTWITTRTASDGELRPKDKNNNFIATCSFIVYYKTYIPTYHYVLLMSYLPIQLYFLHEDVASPTPNCNGKNKSMLGF